MGKELVLSRRNSARRKKVWDEPWHPVGRDSKGAAQPHKEIIDIPIQPTISGPRNPLIGGGEYFGKALPGFHVEPLGVGTKNDMNEKVTEPTTKSGSRKRRLVLWSSGF